MIRRRVRRRERQRLAVMQARHALVSLPNVRWHDHDSEQQAHARVQDIAVTVDRALRRVRTSSDHARVLKYAQAKLTAFLQGWDDAELIAPIHLPEMYQGLVAALRAHSLRLAADESAAPVREPDETCPSIVKPPSSPARPAELQTSLLSGPCASTAREFSIPGRSRRSSYSDDKPTR